MPCRSALASLLWVLVGIFAMAASARGDTGFLVYERSDDNVFEKDRARPGPDGRWLVTYAFDLEEGETFEASAVPLPGDDANPASLDDHLRLYLATDGGGWEKADTLATSHYSDKPAKLRFLFTTEKPGQAVRFRVNFRLQTLGDARPVRVCDTQHGGFSAGNVLQLHFDEPEAGCTYRFTARCKETSLKLYAGRLEEGLVVMTGKESAWSVQEPNEDGVTLTYRPGAGNAFGLRISPENQQVNGSVQLETEIDLPLALTYDPRR